MKFVGSAFSDQADLGGAASGIRANGPGRNAEFLSRVQRWRGDGEYRTRFDEVVHRVNAILRHIHCRLPQAAYRRTSHVGSSHGDPRLQSS